MKIIIFVLSIIIGIKTISYGAFEINQNTNKFGGYFVIILAIISIIFPNIIVSINGI